MLKILIVVNNFTQESLISSKRWRAISRELAKRNEVTVLCGKDPEYHGKIIDTKLLESESLRVVEVDTSRSLSLRKGSDILDQKPQNVISNSSQHEECNSKLEPIKYYISELLRRKIAVRLAKKTWDELENKSFDVVISSVFYTNAFFAAEWIVKKCKPKCFICEVRDQLAHGIKCKPYQVFLMKSLEREIFKKTNMIFTVSKQIKQDFVSDVHNKDIFNKIYVFPHAYAEEDKAECGLLTKNNLEELVVCYTGTVYDNALEESCFKTLFYNIGKARRKDLKIVFKYAGNSDSLIRKWLNESENMENAEVFGLLPKNQALELQQSADILFYKDTSFTGKGPEYINSGKFILCVYPKGKALDMEMAEVVTNARIGACFSADEEQHEIASLLEELFLKKSSGEPLLKDVRMDYIRRYSVERIAEGMEKIIVEFVSGKKNGDTQN